MPQDSIKLCTPISALDTTKQKLKQFSKARESIFPVVCDIGAYPLLIVCHIIVFRIILILQPHVISLSIFTQIMHFKFIFRQIK